MSQQILAILALLLSALPCSAQEAPAEPNQTAPSGLYQQGPTDPRELKASFDPFFAEQMEKLHIPGAVFLVVKDGEIFFTKGYGFADLENKRPVVPHETLFRVGSISKLFTATAVMQLAERGLLNLDDDVNKYLTLFQLEASYPKPVTVANLLTHTGGFDNRVIGYVARSAAAVAPLGSYLAARMPPRVLPPGEMFSYSNHGIALAGYLVEVISGVPFTQYIEENILQPLGMQRSSFRLPPHLEPDLAISYEYNNSYQPLGFFYTNAAPSGALITTAADIAHFMIAHLQNGRHGASRILTEATTQDMHRQHFTSHPRLPGVAYSFIEYFANNQRAIWHGGLIGGFYSLLFLVPEQNLGFFFACTTFRPSLSLLGEQLVRRFFDHYYPVQKVPPRPPAGFQQRAGRFTGSYRGNRYSRRTFEKMDTLFTQVRVTADHDGALVLHDPTGVHEPSRWVEVEPLLFQSVKGDNYLAFREDKPGRITHIFFPPSPGGPVTLEKLPWYETTAFQLSLGGFLVLVFLSACLMWPAGILVRRLRKRPSTAPRPARLARRLAGLISALNLVFLLGMSFALVQLKGEFFLGVPPVVIALLCIPLLTTLLTVALPIYTVLAWKNAYWSVIGRWHYSLITLAALVYIPFLLYWNLLGFQF